MKYMLSAALLYIALAACDDHHEKPKLPSTYATALGIKVYAIVDKADEYPFMEVMATPEVVASFFDGPIARAGDTVEIVCITSESGHIKFKLRVQHHD